MGVRGEGEGRPDGDLLLCDDPQHAYLLLEPCASSTDEIGDDAEVIGLAAVIWWVGDDPRVPEWVSRPRSEVRGKRQAVRGKRYLRGWV